MKFIRLPFLMAAAAMLPVLPAQDAPDAGGGEPSVDQPADQPPGAESSDPLTPPDEAEGQPDGGAPAPERKGPRPTTIFEPTPEGHPGPDHSTLRVTVTGQSWHPQLPWTKLSPSSRRGIGALIKGNRLLVTAQMVANSTYVELERPDDSRKVTAKVVGLDYEMNLALLEAVEPPEDYFQGLVPIELETESRIGDSNLEVWQIGDDGTPVVTKALFKEVGVEPYYLASFGGLVFKLAGLLSDVGSGFTLPITQDNKLAGLLLRYNDTNQVITILPAPMIQLFLSDLEQAPYEGMPSLGLQYATLMDAQLRKFHQVPDDVENGVLVVKVPARSTAEAAGVRINDVLLKVNGFEISSRGDYEDPDYGRLNFGHITRGRTRVGEELTMDVLREGKPLSLKTKMLRQNQADQLVEDYRFDKGPPYLIYGGIIFLELSTDFLRSFGSDWRSVAPLELVYIAGHQDQFEKDHKRIVFLSRVLPGDGTQGYENLNSLVVTQVDGQPIGNLKDLDAVLSKKPEAGIHRLEFTAFPYEIFVDADQAVKDNAVLLPMIRAGEAKRIDP